MKPSLYKAVRSGDVDFLRRIIDGPDGYVLSNQYFNQKTPKENNILHIAAEFKHIVFFSDMIPLQSPLFWARNKRGDTPMHVAARVGCHQIVEFLIRHSINRADEESVVVEATEAHTNVLLRMTNLEKDTALHIAARYGFHHVATLLMQADSQLSCFTNTANESPLFLATTQGFIFTANCILNQCPNSISSFQGINGVTVLHAAVTRLDKQCLAVILLYYEQKETYSLLDNVVLAALDISGMCLSGSKASEPALQKLVKDMVIKNPDLVKEVDALGWSPLHYAAFRGNLEATRVLLMKVGDESDDSACYILDNAGMAALHVAAYAGHIGIMEELIQCRPDTCDLLNDKGQTALHVAVLGEKKNAVKWILQKAELAGLINEPDKDGNTALHLAAIHKNRKIMVILTQDRRVDTNAINKEFFKAIDIFRGNNTQEEIDNGTPKEYISLEESRFYFKSFNVLRKLGRSISVPYFQLQIQRDFWKAESSATTIVDNKQLQEQRRETRLVVAALIATVTFAAAFTVPGGLNSNNGRPVLADDVYFTIFLCANAFSFSMSTFVIFFELVVKDFLAVPIIAFILRGSLVGMLGAFFFGLLAMFINTKHSREEKQDRSLGPLYFFANLGPLNNSLTLALPLLLCSLFPSMLVRGSVEWIKHRNQRMNIQDRVI